MLGENQEQKIILFHIHNHNMYALRQFQKVAIYGTTLYQINFENSLEILKYMKNMGSKIQQWEKQASSHWVEVTGLGLDVQLPKN